MIDNIVLGGNKGRSIVFNITLSLLTILSLVLLLLFANIACTTDILIIVIIIIR